MKQPKISTYICLLSLVLLFFNGYYFFIYRGVGPSYYIQKFLSKPEDNIETTNIYLDLSEEYFYLNQRTNSVSLILFIGDSITKRFHIQEFAAGKNILNRGIFSDTTQGLLNRLNINVNNLRADKLFVMIGYNDLPFRTNAEIVQNIKKILSLSKAERKYVQSLLPVNAERREINERIRSINEQLQKIAIDDGFLYVDLHSHFIDSQHGIRGELSRDGTHLNYFGYRLWFSLIEQLL